MLSDLERCHGIHGGESETSMILHFRPDLVDMDRGMIEVLREVERMPLPGTAA